MSQDNEPPFNYTPVTNNFTQLDEDELHRVGVEVDRLLKEQEEQATKESNKKKHIQDLLTGGPNSGVPCACRVDNKVFQKYHTTIRYKIKPSERQEIINFHNYCLIKCGLDVNEKCSASEEKLHRMMYMAFYDMVWDAKDMSEMQKFGACFAT